MKKMILILLIALASACSNGDSAKSADDAAAVPVSAASDNSPGEPSAAEEPEVRNFASFPYALVKWDDRIYKITSEEVIETGEIIGEITHSSLTETGTTPNNFSNRYEKGTKLWSIKEIDASDAIAIEYAPGKFVKAAIPSAE